MTHWQLQFNLTAKTNPPKPANLLTGRQLNLPITANPPKPQPIEIPDNPLLDKDGEPIIDCPNCHTSNAIYFNGITLQCCHCKQTFYPLPPLPIANPDLTG